MAEFVFREETPVPKDALDYFQRKGLRLSWDHREVYREEHDRAFTVAKVASTDLLRDIKQHVEQALQEGRTLQQFARDLTPVLQKAGWWGKQLQVDPEDPTGELREVQLGSPRRLKTIFDANMRTARAAGQWERAQRTKRARPYFVYELGPSAKHRDEHVKIAGKILPVDHPFWDDWFPPNGWGCKCRVRQISRGEAERLGGVSEPPQSPTVEWTNERTGMTLKVPRGIDSGWDRNPGNYDDQAAVLRRHLGLHPHEKVRHARLYEESAHRMGGVAANRELRRGNAAHLFDKGIDSKVLVSTVLSRGTYEGQDEDTPWRRIWAEVGPIGWRIKRSGSQITDTSRLKVVELKVQLRSNGVWEYHLLPRTRKRGEKGGSDGTGKMG